MYFTQVLRVSRGLMCLAIVLAVIYALVLTTLAANGALHVHPDTSPNGQIPLPALFALSGLIAAFFASRFARSLSEENEAHLPVAWTKPISRVGFALTVMAVDALGIVAAFAITFGSVIAVIALVGALRFIDVPPDSGLQLIRYLAFPLAFYGLITAVTASMGKAGRGFVFWAWVAAFLLSSLAAAGFPKPWDAIFTMLNYINPIHYAAYQHGSGDNNVQFMSTGPHIAMMAVTTDIVALAALCIIGLTAGILQWRRLEA